MDAKYIAVFQDKQGMYGYFDPHSRDSRGYSTDNGTAVMMRFTILNDLIDKLIEVFVSMGTCADCQYEFLPVNFEPVDMSADDQEMAPRVDLSSERTQIDEKTPSEGAGETVTFPVTSQSMQVSEQCYGNETTNSDVLPTKGGFLHKQMPNVSKFEKSKRRKFQRLMMAQPKFSDKIEERKRS